LAEGNKNLYQNGVDTKNYENNHESMKQARVDKYRQNAASHKPNMGKNRPR